MPTAMLRPRQRPSWMPEWLDTFLSDPSTTLATTNIQAAPGAAAQAVALPLLRAILPKLADRTANIPANAQRLTKLVGPDMSGAILKKYPRTLARMGRVGVMDIPGAPARGAYNPFTMNPSHRGAMGDVLIEMDRSAPDATDQMQHLVGHEVFGHGPQDVRGVLALDETDRAMRGEFLPEWIVKTLRRFNTTPYFRRQTVPDIQQRATTLADVPQIFYESAPTELAANTRSFKLRDLARQQMLERTGEPYIPGLGPRENLMKVNQWRKDYVTNRLRQFHPINERTEDIPQLLEQEKFLLKFLEDARGMSKARQHELPLKWR